MSGGQLTIAAGQRSISYMAIELGTPDHSAGIDKNLATHEDTDGFRDSRRGASRS